MDIRKLQRAIVDGLEDVKAQDILVFNTEHLSPLFERVIIASGTSNRQTKALASSVREAVKAAGMDILATEGAENGEWIIVDCGAAVAHIMQPAIRQYYRLEDIWGGKPVKLKASSRRSGLVKASEPMDEDPVEDAPELSDEPMAPERQAAARKGTAGRSAPAKKAAAKAARKSAARKSASGTASAPMSAADKPAARKAAAKKSAARKTTRQSAGQAAAADAPFGAAFGGAFGGTNTVSQPAPRARKPRSGPGGPSGAYAPVSQTLVVKPGLDKPRTAAKKAAAKKAATKKAAARKTAARGA